MNIKEITEFKTCENNYLKTTIYIDGNINHDEIETIAKDSILIQNAITPYFKIVNKNYSIRGSLDSDFISIEFFSSAEHECSKHLQHILTALQTLPQRV